MDSLKGSFLIASPGLTDPNFARTVVFMVEHSAEGAFGLILSRPMDLTLQELCAKLFDETGVGTGEGLPPKEVLSSYPIFTGGPVQQSSVFFLHDATDLGKDVVKPGVCLGSQPEDLRKILNRMNAGKQPQFRIFFGYSGWASNQLEQELKAGGWLVKPATQEQIFQPAPENLWSLLIQSFGGALSIFAMMPPNPELN